MMETVKHVMSSIGCGASDLARSVGGNTADIAKRVGGKSVDLARAVGPKRGIIGIAVLAGAVAGGIYLSRYLKARAQEEANAEVIGETPSARNRKRARARNKAAAAHAMH